MSYVRIQSGHIISDNRNGRARLLTDYELDFSKRATPQLTERVRYVWRSLPGLLTRIRQFGQLEVDIQPGESALHKTAW